MSHNRRYQSWNQQHHQPRFSPYDEYRKDRRSHVDNSQRDDKRHSEHRFFNNNQQQRRGDHCDYKSGQWQQNRRGSYGVPNEANFNTRKNWNSGSRVDTSYTGEQHRRAFADQSYAGESSFMSQEQSQTPPVRQIGKKWKKPIDYNLNNDQPPYDSDDNVRQIDKEDEEKDEIQIKLNQLMGLSRGEVPEYILRMRKLGPMGYPPALIDQQIRVCDALPFFGGSVESVLPKRNICKSSLPAFRGYTHLKGEHVSPEFLELMREVAKKDHETSRSEALSRSGIEEFMSSTQDTIANSADDDSVTERRSSEVIRYEVPKREISDSKDYLFAVETKSMKHNLESFAKGIQPFQNSHINKPTFFMQKLKSILKKSPN